MSDDLILDTVETLETLEAHNHDHDAQSDDFDVADAYTEQE